MMKRIEQLAKDLIEQHLPYGKTPYKWSFAWSCSPKVWGQCCYTGKNIYLSRPIFKLLSRVNGNYYVMGKARDTVLHEIAHAIAGWEADHGPKWIEVCKELGLEDLRIEEEVEGEE